MPKIVSDQIFPIDNQPIYPTRCQTFQLSTASNLSFYFGFSQSNNGVLAPGPAGQIFKFFPQVNLFSHLNY
jgi:hypothetical protein